MNIQDLRKKYLTIKEECNIKLYMDEEALDLLLATVEYVLEHANLGVIPSHYMSLKEFEEKYQFISASTLARYCHKPEFSDICASNGAGHWFVDAEKAIAFLKEIPSFKSKLKRKIFKDLLVQS